MYPGRTRTGLALCLIAGLYGCRSPDTGQELVEWTVSWDPVTTYENGAELSSSPIYRLEMSESLHSGSWESVWTGTSTSATVRAAAGTRCFRAIAIENGVSSEASKPICKTKQS